MTDDYTDTGTVVDEAGGTHRAFFGQGSAGPASARATGAPPPTVGAAIDSFGNLAGTFLADAPVFVLVAISIAGLTGYRGWGLLEGTFLSVTLTVGIFIGVISAAGLIGSGNVPFLIGSMLVLGVLCGGVGTLLGAGARHTRLTLPDALPSSYVTDGYLVELKESVFRETPLTRAEFLDDLRMPPSGTSFVW